MPQSGHVEGLPGTPEAVGLISAGRVGNGTGSRARKRADHVVVSASGVGGPCGAPNGTCPTP